MKKTLLVIALFIVGCSKTQSGNKPRYSYEGAIHEVTIDSCDYIIMGGDNYEKNPSIIHKGNCHNPIHRK